MKNTKSELDNSVVVDQVKLLMLARANRLSVPALLLMFTIERYGNDLSITEVREFYRTVTKKEYNYSAVCGLLNILSKRGLVDKERDGRYMHYSLTKQAQKVLGQLNGAY